MRRTATRVLTGFLAFVCLASLQLLPLPVWGRDHSGAPASGICEAGPPSATEELTLVEAQSDFDLTRKALEEAHSGLYRYVTKVEMDQAFAAQRAKLKRPMTKVEFWAIMSETLAMVRCGHTGIIPDEQMRKAMEGVRFFPLQVAVEGKRLVVTSNDTADDQTIRPGMEILEINGRKVTDILSRMWSTEAADGDIETSKRVHIQRGFPMYYWVLVEQAGDFTVKAQDSAGRIVTPKLAGVKRADRAKNQNPVNAAMQAGVGKLGWSTKNLSVRFLKDPEVAQIRIRSFVGDDYPRWIEDTFKMLREKGAKSLILDLRGNGGGNDMFGAMLVSYLTDKPFRYFDHISIKSIDPSFRRHSDWPADLTGQLREGVTPNPAGGYFVTAKLHQGVAKQLPGKHPFLGKVYVLIDGGTFSTAADFCAVTHHLNRATFIGEETGGGYYGNNSGIMTRVTLPNSKFQVRLPMYEYWNAVPGYDGKRRGTRPDYVVETRVANLLRGVDEQLDLGLKLADNKSPPE